MSVSRVTRRGAGAPDLCAACGRSFLYPDFGVPEGDGWRVLLRCLSCGWSGETTFDEDRLERFERALDAERELIAHDLERLTHQNMREYRDRFVAALAADAIWPEDF